MTSDSLLAEAVAHFQAGRLAEAERLAATLLKAEPGHAGANRMMGFLMLQQGRPDAAMPFLAASLQARADPPTLVNYGLALSAMGRNDEALASFDRALAAGADPFATHFNRGNALRALGRPAEALAAYERALAQDGAQAGARYQRALTLAELGRTAEALGEFDRAIALRPDSADAFFQRGVLLRALWRRREALEDFNRALGLKPDHVDALLARGAFHGETGWMTRAQADFDAVLALHPGHASALGNAFAVAMHLCDWPLVAALSPAIAQAVADGDYSVPVFILMGWRDDPALLRKAAENAIAAAIRSLPPPLWSGVPYRHRRIRLAYVSSDFRQHPVSVLLARLIELHDRARFEVIGISMGPDDGSALRRRIAAAFDRFHDMHGRDPAEVAQLLRSMDVDIAIDLTGHTRDSFPLVFAHRPAPVQVNYLGFCGTTGAAFMDYIIADSVVLPMTQQAFFREKIVQLPHCYLLNDPRQPAEETPTRAAAGLPETGLVFACFNTSWKLSPPVFDIWMRLLQQVPDSVLWLMENYDEASARLRAEAARRGVDPARLVFARHLPMDQHLARHVLADLFLDTLPFNAHTTGSDALWFGVPVVTCMGRGFPARVGASLLQAMGVPELITHSAAEYEALALALARDRARLAGLRRRLLENRARAPLFDIEAYARDIEAAYVHMWETAEAGEAPAAFAVADLPGAPPENPVAADGKPR
jgi:predicted O-linked N-acetylglucosamine transferase (SPINDLY family)